MIINFNGGGGGSYTLPKASQTVLGGIKVGENLTIDTDGKLSSQAGGEQMVELTQAQYNALSAYSEDTTYIITDAPVVDMDDYAELTDLEELSAATVSSLATKATKQTLASPFTGASYYSSAYRFPVWNAEGVITGNDGSGYGAGFSYINGGSCNIVMRNAATLTLFAPTTTGTQNQILKSVGSGAPTWVDFTSYTGGLSFWKGTQEEYDAITTKDASTLYVITD